MTIIEKTHKKSIGLLEKLSTNIGFTASVNNIENYKRIWSRDGVVAGIASLLEENKELTKTFKKTLNTLQKYQDETGRIPSNVSKNKETHISYGTTVGRIDATIWYIVGVTQFVLRTEDKKLWKKHRESVKKAFFYLNCLELNGRGLLYIPQGGDWADEYINRGYVLFDQVLYYLALDGYYKIAKDKKILKKKKKLKNLIKINYVPKKENLENSFVYKKVLFEASLKKCKTSLPISFFTSSEINCHTDSFGTSLLILSGILDKAESKKIKKEMKKRFLEKSYFPIIPAFNPVIDERDPDWQELEKNYLYRFRNKPHEFHNGGLWPLVTGFFFSTFDKKDSDSEKYLSDFAEVLERDKYTFPEFYHGKNHKPMGTPQLGFSASAYIIAYNSIIKNKKIFL